MGLGFRAWRILAFLGFRNLDHAKATPSRPRGGPSEAIVCSKLSNVSIGAQTATGNSSARPGAEPSPSPSPIEKRE